MTQFRGRSRDCGGRGAIIDRLAISEERANDDRTSIGMRTVKNPYDQLVNNAINSQQELHSKENSPESYHSPSASTVSGSEDPAVISADSASSEDGSPELTRENTQSVKMDEEMFIDEDRNPLRILEEVGSMDSWSEGLKDRIKRAEDEVGRELRTGEVEIDSGASTINLKDS